MSVRKEQSLGASASRPGSREPSREGVSAASGFDPSRMMQEFYLSRYYEPKAERPADNVQAAIEFTIDRFFAGERIAHISAAEGVGVMASRILALAKIAGLYVGIKIEGLPCDSNGSGEAGETSTKIEGSTEGDSAVAEGIAQLNRKS